MNFQKLLFIFILDLPGNKNMTYERIRPPRKMNLSPQQRLRGIGLNGTQQSCGELDPERIKT